MMRKQRFNLILFLIILSFGFVGYAQGDTKSAVFTDSVYSTNLSTWRKIKISLPEDYTIKKKYPVFYVLDADWMFEPVLAEVKILSDFEVIPEVIVVGIFSKDRNADLDLGWKDGKYKPSSAAFRDFLLDDLILFISENYSVSGFNVLVGHSNSATYTQKIMTGKDQPFRGFIALSQNLFGDQWAEFSDFLKRKYKKELFYFVASGTRDATMRLETGIKLDSIFKTIKDPKFIAKQKIYPADHSGIAARGLNDGIAHIFSLYRHYNDWDDRLIDSLQKNKISGMDFLNRHAKKMYDIYGIRFKFNQDDLSLLQALAENEKDLVTAMDFEKTNFGQGNHFYATYAQFYEYIKNYEKALDFWKKNIEGQKYEHNNNLFYYRRPVELIAKKMKDPDRAIDFALAERKKYPERSCFFDYMIAKVAAEEQIRKEAGLKAIRDCRAHFKKNRSFTIDDLEKLENKLKG